MINKKFVKKSIILILILSFIVHNSCCTFSGSRYNGEKSDHFDGEEFYNQGDVKMRGTLDLIKWLLLRKQGDWQNWINTTPGSAPPKYAGIGELRITFINHSTVLIQMDSTNILTDPVWSKVVGPMNLIGPGRKRDPGIKFEDLPPIDYVLISHNHYDHMDIPTLKMLKDFCNPLILVPLGNKDYLEKNSLLNVKELDWWQEIQMKNNEKIIFVPAQHLSARGLCDKNASLWGGFVVISSGGPVYFAGDTGFGIHFDQILNKFGPMRFSMLPIGAYIPKDFMEPVHISPEQAVLAHKQLKSQRSLAIHWGTFRQAEDGYIQPVKDLKIALKKHKISALEFSVFKHGLGYNIEKLKTIQN